MTILQLTKICTKCGKEKALEDFSMHNTGKFGKRPDCRECVKVRLKAYYERHKADWPKTGKRKNRVYRYKKRYGITIDDYDAMFQQQGGVCAICGKPEIKTNQYGVKRLSVDHCHKTKRVRGLLCVVCNTRLGVLECERFVCNATAYLRRQNSD